VEEEEADELKKSVGQGEDGGDFPQHRMAADAAGAVEQGLPDARGAERKDPDCGKGCAEPEDLRGHDGSDAQIFAGN